MNMDIILRRKWVLLLTQLCEEDEKIEEQGTCMGENMLLKDNTNKMFRFTILSLQTIS
jgi:hypothetical protein